MNPPPPPLLDVRHLTTVFDVAGRALPAVDDVSFEVRKGETLGLVGESGSGKTMTALSILRLVEPPGRIAGGQILFEGRDLMRLAEREMRRVRGAGIALVFQEPMTALNPVFTVGDQIAEAMIVHGRETRAGARRRAVELLGAVRVADPERAADSYPHQLSGGMQQRVLIAMALSCHPSLVIADEPTTALDVTIQAQILDLLREMRQAFDLAMLLVSHDLGIIAGTADRIAVMYAGRIVEQGPVGSVFASPAHPYTKALLLSIPRGNGGRRLAAIDGAVPAISELPPGCAFAPRCPDAVPTCRAEQPLETSAGPGRVVSCHVHGQPAGGN
jgi:oligopeptide/dipeptide ABC transporter ATP-binding protein